MTSMKGLTADEIVFWEKFRDSYLADIDFALKHDKSIQALRDMLCMIDALAGLFTGRTDRGVEESWFSFIDRVMKLSKTLNISDMELYFPNLEIYEYSRSSRNVRRKTEKVENCCALLYSIFRTGVVHDGVLPKSFYISQTSDDLWEVEEEGGKYQIGLNISELFQVLKESINRFEKAFETDTERAEHFKQRHTFLKDRYVLKKIGT